MFLFVYLWINFLYDRSFKILINWDYPQSIKWYFTIPDVKVIIGNTIPYAKVIIGNTISSANVIIVNKIPYVK